jgi:hypothetical protein
MLYAAEGGEDLLQWDVKVMEAVLIGVEEGIGSRVSCEGEGKV